ncbi:MAG TPA: glycosyltransferase family 4 protein [Solirubrobacteraceae bacterium]|nr:glycosyltransferase family 4 protein [Solirubrobacteraceae bacterium]
MTRTRVLYFCPDMYLGPVMSVYGQIIRGLDPSRFESYAAINGAATGALPFGPSDAIVTRWRLGSGLRSGGVTARAASSLFLMSAMLRLARYARREQIDIVQCECTAYAGTLGLVLARMARLPVLMHVHHLVGRHAGGAGAYGFPRRQLGPRLVRQADEIVSVSHFIAEQARQVAAPSRAIPVVENGVSLERFHPGISGTQIRREYGVDDDDILVLQLGRIFESKRQEDFIAAFDDARATLPALRGLVVGAEDPCYAGYKSRLTRMCEEHELGERFLIADARPAAPELIAAADIVVAPSLDEAWGLVVAEAMAAGKPVIAARSGATPEVMVDGVTGFLVPPRSPAALAEKLVLLGRDADLRRAMGAAGRRHAQQELAESRVAEKFEPIYERLASRSSSRR